MTRRKKVVSVILSFIYTLFLVVGTSFKIDNSLSIITNYLFFSIIVFIILMIVFYYIIELIIKKLDNYNESNSFTFKLLSNKTFIFCLIFIIICWIPYIVAFYPTILSRDPSFQIKQFFGIPNKYSNYQIMLDANQLITNHHPVIHTLLLGYCLKFGTLINNHNLGLFLYSIIQILVLSMTFSYSLNFLKKQGVSYKCLFLILLVYSFVPVFPFYAMSCVKDVIFSCLIIIYILVLYNLIKNKKIINVIDIIKSVFLIILIVLFRNNGIYVVVLSFPFLFLCLKREWKKLLLIFMIIISFNFSYNKIILPHFKITSGSIREVLSIPFQQTARYVKNYEVTNEELNGINGILNYKKIRKKYNPELSDSVKGTFNINYTDEDLNKYFSVWFKDLLKHPMCYIEATINNTYGYFYPFKHSWYFYYKYNDIIVSDGFNYNYNNLYILRNELINYGLVFPYIPILGLIVNIGFNTWILIFMFTYLIYKRKYKYIIYLLPSIISLLVCVASPANTYFRYAMPIVFSMPIMVALFINVLKEKE